MKALQVLWVALCIALVGCAGHAPPPHVAEPAPVAPDPRICAPIEPEPAPAGGIVQPATQPERDAVEDFLNGAAELRFWGRRGWERASLARTQFCPTGR